mmetsp:Transcript_14807/g.55806  ORF Transcript_14807/g.55806 Transcript_14807/m.55806 type:complete len:208 (+) Transcript_14807:188-811(+)
MRSTSMAGRAAPLSHAFMAFRSSSVGFHVGKGTVMSSGKGLDLTRKQSRILRTVPVLPGTLPRRYTRFRLTSILKTCRASAVRCSPPIWPGIFLPFHTFPGDVLFPVEPIWRWVLDTPWVARWPPKPQRFITPAKPFPAVMPVTSTYWPGMKCLAVMGVPTGRIASSETRNSASRSVGSWPALAKWPAMGWFTRLGLRRPAPTWRAV